MVLMLTLVWSKYFTSRRGLKRMLGKSGYCINMARFSLAQVSSHDSFLISLLLEALVSRSEIGHASWKHSPMFQDRGLLCDALQPQTLNPKPLRILSVKPEASNTTPKTPKPRLSILHHAFDLGAPL